MSSLLQPSLHSPCLQTRDSRRLFSTSVTASTVSSASKVTSAAAATKVVRLSILSFLLLLTTSFDCTMFTTASKYGSRIRTRTLSACAATRTGTTANMLSAFAYPNNNNNNKGINVNCRRNRRHFSPFASFSTSILNDQTTTTTTTNNAYRDQHHTHHGIRYSRLFSLAPNQHHMLEEDNIIEDEDNNNSNLSSISSKDIKATTPTKPEVIIKSKPKKGGNWNPKKPIEWSKNFGRRDPEKEKELFQKAQLKPNDEGYFDVSTITVPGVTMVRTVEEARIVMKQLMSKESQKAIHACDTEVMDIQLKDVGPVGNGYVTCASIYSGPDFDYGLGDGPGTALWIDNLDDSFGVLQEFKEFFEDERYQTVWHNYGFDRHVMWNEGIDVKGLKGDTMHMARLEDTSRAKYGTGMGYSLEALTGDIVGRRKKPMKEMFGVARLRKDGSAGSLVDVPPVEVLQRDPRFRRNWIVYSAYDAEGTWLLREQLQKRLEKMDWVSKVPCFIMLCYVMLLHISMHCLQSSFICMYE